MAENARTLAENSEIAELLVKTDSGGELSEDFVSYVESLLDGGVPDPVHPGFRNARADGRPTP
jgi:hypothetical protein